MAFMVAAYLIIWLAAFGFIFSMVLRQNTLQREIKTLRELLNDKTTKWQQ